MKRDIISVVVGLATAFITFLIVETINASLHPTPTNLDFKDSIAVKTFYENQPLSLWLMVLAGWVVGSFLCGLLIKWISKNENKKPPLVAGFILTFSAIANFFSLPHPTWFMVISLLVFIPSTLLGHNIYKLKTNGHR
jgi:hypothetical protein